MCTPCQGYPSKICNGNGDCSGEGTKYGTGECKCFDGYDGEDCSICAKNYYASYKDENKLLCSKCHPACDGECTGPGSNGEFSNFNILQGILSKKNFFKHKV